MDIEIRPARPEDADAAVPLIYSSGPAAFDYVFSHRTQVSAKGYLHQAFQRAGGEFGYGNHIVATLGGEVVGTGAGFSGRDSLAFAISALTTIFGTYGVVQGLRVIRRGLQVESVVPPPKGRLHYIAHLGVTPDVRSHGIGTRVVEHLLQSGRELGRTTAGLDVSVENPRAEALYERMGFYVTKENISNYSNDTAVVPSHRRMERSLET